MWTVEAPFFLAEVLVGVPAEGPWEAVEDPVQSVGARVRVPRLRQAPHKEPSPRFVPSWLHKTAFLHYRCRVAAGLAADSRNCPENDMPPLRTVSVPVSHRALVVQCATMRIPLCDAWPQACELGLRG